jgi:hypothetical protein
MGRLVLIFLLTSCLINPHELGFRTDTFTPEDLPAMIVWLDGTRYTTIRDNSGVNANIPAFDGAARYFDDVSGSANIHNFFQTTAGRRPLFNSVTGFFSYDGIDDFLTVSNHTDLNTSDVAQRNLSVAFRSGSDVSRRQMVYDEGGSIRGMNIYIFNGDLYCGFYNIPNDNDGSQPFLSVTTPIAIDSTYFVSWVFDYTNYTTPSGPDGSLECYVNGVSIGSVATTSRLFAHSGAIALGAVSGDTVMDNGVLSSGAYFAGSIMEVMIFNNPPSSDDIVDVHRYLSFKWLD